MQKIILKNTLPRVFAERETNVSQVWLNDIEFVKGAKYIISAESGTGKSSLCSYMYGFRNDYSGVIAFDDKDVSTFKVGDWCDVRKHNIAYLPQELRLFLELTALENVLLKNKLTGYKTQKEIEALFELLGISEQLNSEAGRISIGQQQRVAIIRTLCQPCDFFLLDEPVSHLDAVNNEIISNLIEEEAHKQGAGIIATSVGNHISINVDKEFKL